MKLGIFVLLVALACVVVVSPGCLSSSPTAQPVQSTPSSPASATAQVTTPPSVSVPVVVTTVPTGVIQNPAAPEYVKRPYGYVPSTYHPGYQARLLESHIDKDMATGDRRIVGTVKNIGTETIDLLVVTADLYNNQGYLIGTVSVDVYYLGAGKTWQFRSEPITVPDYSYYEIARVFTG